MSAPKHRSSRAWAIVNTVVIAGSLTPALGGDALAAQAPSVVARVRGTVVDSVSMRPLADAVVQLVSLANATLARSVRTGDDGRFVFDSVAAGTYLLGFYHLALDSLGITGPLTRVDVRTSGDIVAPLSTPSARSLLASLCGAQALQDSTGVFLSFVRESRMGGGQSGAEVRVSWAELTIGSGGISRSTPSVQGRTGDTGAVALCGLPRGALVLARAWLGGDSTGFAELEVPASGLLRRDLYIGSARIDTLRAMTADSQAISTTVLRGTGTLRGRVRDAQGRPLAGARVGMWGSGLEGTADAEGNVRIGQLPSGTYTLEARAIGFIPVRRPIDVPEGGEAMADVQLESFGQYLDTVKVVGERVYVSSRPREFEERRKSGFGYFMDETAIERRSPMFVADLMRMIPGVFVMPGRSASSQVYMRGMGFSAYCTPVVFVDGMRVTTLDGDLESVMNVQDIRALEVYPRTGSIPAQFQTLEGCGSIVVWTGGRRPLLPSRR